MQVKIKPSFSKPSDYRKVLCGKRFSTQYFDVRVYYKLTEHTSNNEIRYAVNASKKIGNACKRNLVKRRMRSLAREFIPRNIMANWMIIAKPPICNTEYYKLQKHMATIMLNCEKNVSFFKKQKRS